MATGEQIRETYDYMDPLFRASLGPHADITCALFDGDFSLSLEEAQRRKHDYILNNTNLRPGQRLLDIGCGWGGLLAAVRARGGKGVGVTLSPAQARHCQRSGLDVHLLDWRVMGRRFGTFDAVASVGAFEHFCSREEYQAGKQEEIYRDFFSLAADLLPPGGRLFVQTMTWGKEVPDSSQIDLRGEQGSLQRILGAIEKFYPGSWLPSGLDQLTRVAADRFDVVEVKNGRLDYIETMIRWSDKVSEFRFSKVIPALRATLRAWTNPDFSYRFETLKNGYNRLCFERGVMDHYRVTYEKVSS
jgi:cyclopropane-fatty-acyl-phospholipid synthase